MAGAPETLLLMQAIATEGGDVCVPWEVVAFVSAVISALAGAVIAQWRANGELNRRIEERLDWALGREEEHRHAG